MIRLAAVPLTASLVTPLPTVSETALWVPSTFTPRVLHYNYVYYV